MTQARQTTGHRAEELVGTRLERSGWRIVERNARTRYGEIDIVAIENRALVFVEVKAGTEGARAGPERPVLSIGAIKQQRLRRLAVAWLTRQSRVPFHTETRFDAVGVTFGRDGAVAAYEHIRNAF
jgi:putative endonuclease